MAVRNLAMGQPIDDRTSEAYQPLVLDQWLGTTVHHNKSLQLAIRRLADAMLREHRDHWLTSFLASQHSPQGDIHLKNSISLNYSGNSDYAEREAIAAKQHYASAQNQAGMLRAELEIVYALRRQSRGIACRTEIEDLKGFTSSHQFTWLEIQLGIENSICAGMNNDFDTASRIAAASLLVSQKAHYPALQLRTRGLIASWNTLEDRLESSWISNSDGLAFDWQRPFPPERAFQFYSDLEMAAEQAQIWYVATLLQREALAMLNHTERIDFQAIAHSRMATDLMHCGENRAAQNELIAAQKLFNQLAEPTRSRFLAFSWLELAKLEIKSGSLQDAAQILRNIEHQFLRSTNFTVQIPLEESLADYSRITMNPNAERVHLEHVIGLVSRGLHALKSDQERWDWRYQEGQAYRRLVEMDIDTGKPFSGLQRWRAYEMAANRIPRAISNPIPHVAGRLSATIVITVLPTKLAIWVIRKDGIHSRNVDIRSPELQTLERQFFNLCSDPTSPLTKVNQVGLRLYMLMIAPIESEIRGLKHLDIDADEPLGSLPWGALVLPNGHYLSEEYDLTVSSGATVRRHTRSASTGTALLVYPGTGHQNNTFYQALPNAQVEIQYVASLFPHSRVIKGQSATPMQILKTLPSASLFHFAGHAIARDRGGELVLSGTNDFLSASSISKLSLTNVDLVFLAACSSAQSGGSPLRNPYGLVSSFLQSGTQTVIASEWAVDSSSTSAFTRAFYHEYKITHDAADAIRAAINAVRAMPHRNHPFYWASFQAFGQ